MKLVLFILLLAKAYCGCSALEGSLCVQCDPYSQLVAGTCIPVESVQNYTVGNSTQASILGAQGEGEGLPITRLENKDEEDDDDEDGGFLAAFMSLYTVTGYLIAAGVICCVCLVTAFLLLGQEKKNYAFGAFLCAAGIWFLPILLGVLLFACCVFFCGGGWKEERYMRAADSTVRIGA